jgi:hypothetical protein
MLHTILEEEQRPIIEIQQHTNTVALLVLAHRFTTMRSTGVRNVGRGGSTELP